MLKDTIIFILIGVLIAHWAAMMFNIAASENAKQYMYKYKDMLFTQFLYVYTMCLTMPLQPINLHTDLIVITIAIIYSLIAVKIWSKIADTKVYSILLTIPNILTFCVLLLLINEKQEKILSYMFYMFLSVLTIIQILKNVYEKEIEKE